MHSESTPMLVGLGGDRAASFGPPEWPLERYADYLSFLTRIQFSARLQAKFDVSDIVQQALLQAHAARAGFRGRSEGEWLAWLRVILANVIANAARQFDTGARDLQRERSLEGGPEGSSHLECCLVAEQSSPSERTVRGGDVLRLFRELGDLPADQRRVVELHHLQGLPVARVAELIGRSRSAVVGLLYRGVKALRERLSGPGEDEA
jgi:RNA polymerase sigma-70 factor (ECF subfamily)